MTLALVGLLGGLGAAARFWADGWVRARWTTRLPWSTIGINVLGSLVIGVLAGLLAGGAIPTNVYTVAATGFCGGFTTFSTATVETVRLAQQGAYERAAVNAFGTLVLTVVAATLGYALGTAIGS